MDSIVPFQPNRNPLVFDFHGHPIRIVMVDAKPYFVASDVCAALELNNVSMALAKLKPDEKGISKVDTLSGGIQDMSIVTESGLYRLVFRSNKPEAEEFRLWVFNEVLPQIMRTGSYVPNSTAITKPNDMLDALEGIVANLRNQQNQIAAIQWQQDNLQANQHQLDSRVVKLEKRPRKDYATVADYMYDRGYLETPERLAGYEERAMRMSVEAGYDIQQLDGDRLAFHNDVLKRL